MKAVGTDMAGVGGARYREFMNQIEGSGKRLKRAEDATMKAFEGGDENEIARAQMVYQKEQRIFSLLTTMIKNLHEMLMGIVRLLRVQ